MHNQPGPGGGPQTSRGEAAPQPRAGRVTTVLLAVTLALVVVLAGVLAAIAVLMTRNPDVPILSTPQIRRLATPIHFAPVTAVPAFPHDHSGSLAARDVEVDGEAVPYLHLFDWIALASALHLPAVSAPAGRTAAGLPVGVQLIAPLDREDRLLDLAEALELADVGAAQR